ncbi:hypothetical protein PR202_ga30375 [Eleusine coracana subsp. coracana]|uniref:Uncharacterized protein n=1 Tax=Eleusine coracana subsp. coracana TaxID=191504 RepID=A0AAV5DNQ6_ELECO|nr:hypothetical protein PR202_ga30375 [Eleusine coracana subsp. coracana]
MANSRPLCKRTGFFFEERVNSVQLISIRSTVTSMVTCPVNRELTQLSDTGYKVNPDTAPWERQLLQLNLSGTLAPEIGQLSKMQIMDFMWNSISGSIPKEVGNITSLELLLLNGNHLSGSLPEEIGFLPNLNRIQIDQNQISGPIPKSFAYLNKTKHFHMNNNSLSGQIPPELSRLPSLVHLLLDNNNLSGYLPPELSNLPKLLIIANPGVTRVLQTVANEAVLGMYLEQG